MADTKYTYSISSDFPNKQVDSDSLTTEIEASSISSAALLYIETNGDGCDIWFDDQILTGEQVTLGGIVAAHSGVPADYLAQGGIALDSLSVPGAPTVTAQGTPGSVSWGYKVTAFSESGETLASAEGTTTTGAATLNGANFNRITWDAVAGAGKYGIYRSTASGTPGSTGKIIEVSGAGDLQFDDTGQAASGSEPTSNTSGAISVVDGTIAIGASSMTGGERLKVVGTVFIDQDKNAAGFVIDSEATGSPLIDFQQVSTNTRGDIAFGVVRIADPSAPSEGDFWYQSTEHQFRYNDGAGVVAVFSKPVQTVIVAVSGGDFTSIKSAVDSVTDATSSKRYVVLVYPGVYSEAPITLKQYVAIDGVAAGMVVVNPINNAAPLFTAVSGASLRKLLINCPTAEAGVKASAGVQFVQVENCLFGGATAGQTAIHATGAGSHIIVEECKFFSTVATAILSESSGRVDCSSVLSYASTTFYANGGTIWIHNSGCQNGTNGYYANNGGTIYGTSVTCENTTNAIRLGATGINEITGVGFEVRSSTTYDVLQENATGHLHVVASRLDVEKFSITSWNGIDPVFGTTQEDRERYVVHRDFEVGVAEKGHDTQLGEGSSYTRGMVVITSDGTATSTTDGGNLTDVSAAAASPTGSTFAYQGVTANHCIYFGSSLSDGTDVLKHWAVRLAQTTAAVEVTKRSFAFEIWDGAAWAEISVMAIQSDTMFRYANEVFIRANTSEYAMYGIDADTTWTKRTILGSNLYWCRIRISTTVTTAPVFQQSRLVPSYTLTSKDGTMWFRGLARFRQTIIGAGNIFGESGGVTTPNPAVGTGGLPTGWNHNIKNSLLNGNGDAVYAQFTVPRGTDTSQPMNIRGYLMPMNGGAGTVSMITSFLPVEAEGVLEADPAGGTTPVARTLANTETVTAKVAQTDTQTYPSGVQDKIQSVVFGPFDISSYYEGDALLVRLEMDDDGAGNADSLVWMVEVDGAKWTHGERLG